MSNAAHQLESLSDKITRLKRELVSYENARDQILAIGQSHAGGGASTNYAELQRLEARIDHLRAQVDALTAQLTGADFQRGVNLAEHRSDYF
jgi:phage shock protein A